jgi:hypothetical protein
MQITPATTISVTVKKCQVLFQEMSSTTTNAL